LEWCMTLVARSRSFLQNDISSTITFNKWCLPRRSFTPMSMTGRVNYNSTPNTTLDGD
jgi:hypothetical protein